MKLLEINGKITSKHSYNFLMRIATIIITYNAMPWIEKCLNSIQNSSLSSHVYIRDNGSTDGTQEYIQSHFPEVRFSQSVENLGFGKANNLELESAYKDGADFFFLLNQDAYLFPDTLEKLMKVAQNNPEFGIISPIHLAGDEKTLDFGFRNYIKRDQTSNHLLSDLLVEKNSLNDIYELDFINAAAWLLPKSTLEKVGGFSPLFFHYGEDRNYVNRVHSNYLKVGFNTKSYVIHDRKQQASNSSQKYPYLRLSYQISLQDKNLNLENYQSVYAKKMMKNIFLLQFNHLHKNWNEYKYLRANKKRLQSFLQKEKEPNAFLNLTIK